MRQSPKATGLYEVIVNVERPIQARASFLEIERRPLHEVGFFRDASTSKLRSACCDR